MTKITRRLCKRCSKKTNHERRASGRLMLVICRKCGESEYREAAVRAG